MSKLTAFELTVIFDTLSGSTAITDGGHIFTFTKEVRSQTANKVARVLDDITVTVAEGEQDE